LSCWKADSKGEDCHAIFHLSNNQNGHAKIVTVPSSLLQHQSSLDENNASADFGTSSGTNLPAPSF